MRNGRGVAVCGMGMMEKWDGVYKQGFERVEALKH